MRSRAWIPLAALILAAAATLARPAHAIQTHVVGVSGPCGAISASVTLVHIHDDGNGEDRFWFRVFEANTANLLVQIDESISRAESPFYWQTGPLAASSANGLYRVELWDLDGEGKPIRQVEQVYYQCLTGAAWRPNEDFEQDEEIPPITCTARVPVWSTNTAPEPGAVIAVWSYGRNLTDDEFHVATIPVRTGDRLREAGLIAPCGVYVRLYFQPDDTQERLFLRSQYHPHDNYGTPTRHNALAPWYTTRFPAP